MMRFTRLQLRRFDPLAKAIDWECWLRSTDWTKGSTLLKQDAGAWVRAVTCPSALAALGFAGELIIKARPHARHDAIKRVVRCTRGDRQWRGAVWLHEHGFASARSFILADVDIDGVPHEVIIMQRLRGPTLLELIERVTAGDGPPVPAQHAVSRELGHHIARLDMLGRSNRDGKPSNLIVLGVPALGGPALRAEFYGAADLRAATSLVDISCRSTTGVSNPTHHISIAPIDTVAIRRSHPVRLKKWSQCEAMLARLYIEPLGCGCPPRRTLCLRAVLAMIAEREHILPGHHAHKAGHFLRAARGVGSSSRIRVRHPFDPVRRAAVRGCWARLGQIIEAHGDPRPKVRPTLADDRTAKNACP